MYEINSILLVVGLFLLILLAYEVCFRLGSRAQDRSDKEIKTQTNAIQAGILGLLALLLGFTFNMALQRYDARSLAVIAESNAIGTALLRTLLLPQPYDSVSQALLRKYVDLRLEVDNLDLTNSQERNRMSADTDVLQHQIWDTAVKATRKDPNPATTGNYLDALNLVFDARSERNAALQRHVPEPILLLLFLIFVVSGGLIGYASGLGQRRAYIPAVIFTFLIALVVFIIIDLDRPQRGIIHINQDSLIDLKRN